MLIDVLCLLSAIYTCFWNSGRLYLAIFSSMLGICVFDARYSAYFLQIWLRLYVDLLMMCLSICIGKLNWPCRLNSRDIVL